MRNRNNQIIVFLSDKELNILKHKCQTAGLSRSSLLRSLITQTQIKARPTAEYIELLRELSAIGNNINQIARVANTCGNVERERIAEVFSVFDKLWAKVKGG